MYAARSELLLDFRRQYVVGLAVVVLGYRDFIAPVANLGGFVKRLAGGEAGGEVLIGRVLLTCGALALARGEQLFSKVEALVLALGRHSLDFNQVHTDAYDHSAYCSGAIRAMTGVTNEGISASCITGPLSG